MAGFMEMAKELGKALGRTDEHQALQRAITAANDDRDFVELRNQMESVNTKVNDLLRRGEQPDETMAKEYEEALAALQSNGHYQRLVAAQTNFEKLLGRVNDTISEGIQEGMEGRIIIPS